MSRWEPNAGERLEQAALELYLERGYERTTVAEIARRAGLTERTYFRYFADKREVLFAGSAALHDRLVSTLADGDVDVADPVAAVTEALVAVTTIIGPRRERSRRRQGVIDANPVLQERELVKLASWSAALTTGLRTRGVPEPTARLVAETGVAVFRVAFERWVSGPDDDLTGLVRAAFAELRSVAG